MNPQGRKAELWTAAMAPEPDSYEVAARVSTIPDTAAAVIRYANSAFVGAVYPVGTVLEAVVRVGCRTVGALAMASLNRDLVETWGAPELWEQSLIVGRAAKVIANLRGVDRNEAEQLFVAGLFSCSGLAGLTKQDDGYLTWRRQQWMRGLTDAQLLEKEELIYGVRHDQLSAQLLAEWNLPPAVAAPVVAHHDPNTLHDEIVRTAIAALPGDAEARCIDVPFKRAMQTIGLGEHHRFVENEAMLFAETAGAAFESEQPAPAERFTLR